jgi:hypothetical protein
VPLNTSTKSAPPPSAAVQANSCLLWTAGLRAFSSASTKRPRRARDGQINRQWWQRWQTTGHRAGASTPACRPTLQAGTPGAACWRLDCSPALGACHHVNDGNRRWAASSNTSHSRAATAFFSPSVWLRPCASFQQPLLQCLLVVLAQSHIAACPLAPPAHASLAGMSQQQLQQLSRNFKPPPIPPHLMADVKKM